MISDVFKCMVLFHNHVHVKFYFVAGMFNSKILNHLKGLLPGYLLILYVDFEIIQPWQKDKVGIRDIYTL